MPTRRTRIVIRLVLTAAFALGLAWVLRLDHAAHISTDVLDLVPADERDAELTLVRSLASERQGRVALFALRTPDHDGARARVAADAFAAALRASPAFAEVVPLHDTSTRDALGRLVFGQRFDLLLPGWLERHAAAYAQSGAGEPWPEWLAQRTAEELEAFLSQPEAMGMEDLLRADPLLLVPPLIESTQALGDTALAGGETGDAALVWALTAAPPLREEGQQPVFAAVEAALAAACAAVPDAQLQWTAVSRFAAESRQRIEAEMKSLNLLSLAAVLAVVALGLRRPLRVLHLAPVVLGALLAGWVAVTLVWDRVHVLVFVVGSLLAGVAVDYGLHVWLDPRRGPADTYAAKVRRLLKPLLACAVTTALGFSLLLASELPLIRQLGLFVSAGLAGALAMALLWFAQVREPWMETRPLLRARPRARTGGAPLRWAARMLLATGLAVAVLGPWRLHWRDDIRELEVPAPELRENDQAVRALFGESGDRSFYLARGDTPAAARAALARFMAWHAQEFPGSAVASPGLVLPTEAAWRALPERLGELDTFPAALRDALEARGFEAGGFDAFFSAWDEWRARGPARDYDALVHALTDPLRGPLGLLCSVRPEASWFGVVADHAPGAEPPPDTHTVSAAQLQSLNRLFARYRTSALRLSVTGLGLLGAGVLVLYGWRRGGAVFALPAGACLFAFGVFGLAGQTLNFFHLLGAFLGVCLSHDYAIFAAAHDAHDDTAPPSIRLSALTTAASFGVLALSAIPVVAALGSTVALVVLAALAGVEILPLVRARRP